MAYELTGPRSGGTPLWATAAPTSCKSTQPKGEVRWPWTAWTRQDEALCCFGAAGQHVSASLEGKCREHLVLLTGPVPCNLAWAQATARTEAGRAPEGRHVGHESEGREHGPSGGARIRRAGPNSAQAANGTVEICSARARVIAAGDASAGLTGTWPWPSSESRSLVLPAPSWCRPRSSMAPRLQRRPGRARWERRG